KGTMGKDGTYVRCGELRFLPLAEPCPPDQLRWGVDAWKAIATALPIRTGNDRKTYVVWKELGVTSWAELAAKLSAPAEVSADASTAPRAAAVDDGTGQLSAKGKHLVIAGHARELIEADACPSGARRGRYASWRAIVDAIPYARADRKVAVDWPALSARHDLVPAVESWAALAAVLDARPPPPKPTAATEPTPEPTTEPTTEPTPEPTPDVPAV
ncbi:MAG: hypothetical protein NT062_09875, partial [Proteobacteria bacterium]|nr:hypothetical protein [Pseudomonadota bacterium]